MRVTVELAPIEHRRLRRLCDEFAEQIDAPMVAGAEVVRALLEELHADKDLAGRIAGRLAQTGGSRRR